MKQYPFIITIFAICLLVSGCSSSTMSNGSSYNLSGESENWKIQYSLQPTVKTADGKTIYTETISFSYKGKQPAGVRSIQVGAEPTHVYCGQILGGRDRLPGDGIMKDERSCNLKQIDKSQESNIYISWQDESIFGRLVGEDIKLK